jgi:peptidyl-prolyl cis-trans isomerase A (cyclophilin A)
MLHFECLSCKAKCESADSTAGMTIACPHCRKSVIVPNQSTVANSGAIVFRNVVLVLVGLALVAFVVMLAIPETHKGDGKSGGGANPVVVIETSMGNIKVELFPDKAPISVENFLKYVDDKHYDGTIFHRVIPDFMIQGGGFDAATKQEKRGRNPIKNEATNGLSNDRWTIAMARTNDPHSATAQFYINVKDNPALNPGGNSAAGYAVFGRVIDGMDVVDNIRFIRTENMGGAFTNAPVPDVIIKSIRRVDSK